MKTKTKWVTTREPNLLKNAASGRFYGRFNVSGKQKWVNLDTDKFSVAKLRLADERVKTERGRLAEKNVASGTGTMGEIAEIFLTRLAADRAIKPITRTGYQVVLATLRRTWPDFDRVAPDRITKSATIDWRDRLAANGTGHRPPGAKSETRLANGSSAAHINKILDVLRRLLEIAIEKGQVAENPLNARGVKLSAKSKKVNLPDPTALNSLFAEIERRGKLGGRGGGRTADFCRFLAVTGCRLSEATATRWQDVNFITGTLTINGTKTDAAARTIPMVPAARTLLEKLNAERVSPENVTAPLFSIRSAKKALKAACDALKLPRLTHHDLRDAFATTCIEGGVDIPTVAAWLGHVDGGALLMKVYAHHRMPHSLAQAAKVSFGEE
jgi:integrase